MIENIHNKRNFDRKLFCNDIIPLSPEKLSPKDTTAQAAAPSTQSATSPPLQPVLPPPISPLSLPGTPATRLHAQSMIPETPDTNMQHLVNLDLLGKHSLSLRTPIKESLADDILKSYNPHLLKVQAMMTDVKESLSDFGSCLGSSSSDSEADTSGGELLYKTVGKKKNGKKRKNSTSPSKDYFLKKLNIAISPQ